TPPKRTVDRFTQNSARASSQVKPQASSVAIEPGTPLSRVLHVSQLSLVSPAGTHEEFVDRDGDLRADDRATFDAAGGSYDIAVGRTGARYEVFTAVDDRGTSTTADDVSTGVLVLALDNNGDYARDSSATFDLGRDFCLPSAVSVVSGTSSAGREFVVVSSGGYYNSEDPDDPNNEESPGVVLLVRDPATGGFDAARSRALVSVGDDRLFNANALALLPGGHLLVADFQSNELRIVRDTNADAVPDTLDANPYYVFPFADDAPLDVAANSRGVVFTHSTGNDTYMLAVYDTDGDGDGDADEVCAEGLSIDNNLVLHGLTVARDGTVYVIQDAMGESDLAAEGGNGGIPHVYAFPDPALNGVLRDGAAFVLADDEFTQAYSGLSFGVETALPPVARLTVTNSASLQGGPPSGGLATVSGAGLTRGLSGATQADAAARAVRVTVEGTNVPVLSFDDARIHVQVPQSLGAGVASFVVTVGGRVTAADDSTIVNANPGLFTVPQTGAGEAVALLVSGSFYTRAPFPARTGDAASEVALFGTGWRNSLPVTVHVGGRAARVSYAGPSGGFPGLDQLNVVVPDGVTGAAPVIVTTAGGATSRAGVFVTVQ
ncbi:MAG TPA: IPT/TIG domain-containing protein, partial [Pyrinomonadaceae bacterium]